MEAVLFILGLVLGLVIAFVRTRRILVGTIRTARDEDGFEYPYLELNSRNDYDKISKCKYVLMRVGRGVDLSQK